jgi:hypothetical protein
MPIALIQYLEALQRPLLRPARAAGTKQYSQISALQKKYLDSYLFRCRRAKKGKHDRSACDFALFSWAVKCDLSPESIWSLVYNVGKFAEPAHGQNYFWLTYKKALQTG